MSQFPIPMKKNKKLVYLSSLREEKEMFESPERRIDVSQNVSFKAQEIVDDHSSFRHGMMREVDVGTGLSGALKLLRDQGTFKEEESKLPSSSTSVGYNLDDERFRDRFKDIRIDRVDEHGRILNQREAYRSIGHSFHGKQPGKKKQEKRRKKKLCEDKQKQMETSDRAVEIMRGVHAISRSPYIALQS